MRVNKRMLVSRLENINRQLGIEFCLTWDTCYKIWTLTKYRDESCVINTASTREMLKYLDGIITGIAMKDGAYV